MFTYSPHSSILGSLRVQVPLTLSTHSSSSERVGTHTAGRKECFEDNALYKCECRIREPYMHICRVSFRNVFKGGGEGGERAQGENIKVSGGEEVHVHVYMFNVYRVVLI